MATVHAPSSLERASQIALVLAHHELWSLVEVLDLGRFVPFHLRRSAPAQPDNTELHTPVLATWDVRSEKRHFQSDLVVPCCL
jgi:hypothetical protein